MSEKNERDEFAQRMEDAYHRMLGRVKTALEEVEKDARPTVDKAIDQAKETATELNELTREEAEKIAGYMRKDLHDAADFMSETGRDLRDWLRFDLEAAEYGLGDIFLRVVDRTRLEIQNFTSRADALGEWHSGEITGIGTLECKGCGELLHFHKVGHIPPCPKCHGTRYRRVSHRDDFER